MRKTMLGKTNSRRIFTSGIIAAPLMTMGWWCNALRADPGNSPATIPATTEPAPEQTESMHAPVPIQQELIQRYQELSKQFEKQMLDKDYTSALATIDFVLKFVPDDSGSLYNRACCLARMGKTTEALAALNRSISWGFLDVDHTLTDPDLNSLHSDPEFDKAIATMRKGQANVYASRPVEKGIKLDGVKTLEGNPQGGLRYRIRMGEDADSKHPERLIIWLHPSGGSMDSTVEKLAPEFIKRHFALMVLTQKDYMGWSQDDVDRLMKKTMPEVARIEGIDTNRPILMGFSAGGQLAIQLYEQNPGGFAGMILNSAYPVAVLSQGQIKLLPPPNSDAVKTDPIFVVGGSADGGMQIWDKEAPIWKKAGVPLEIHVVAGRRHEYLFDTEQQKLLFQWLDKLNNAPATQPTTEIDDQ